MFSLPEFHFCCRNERIAAAPVPIWNHRRRPIAASRPCRTNLRVRTPILLISLAVAGCGKSPHANAVENAENPPVAIPPQPQSKPQSSEPAPSTVRFQKTRSIPKSAKSRALAVIVVTAACWSRGNSAMPTGCGRKAASERLRSPVRSARANMPKVESWRSRADGRRCRFELCRHTLPVDGKDEKWRSIQRLQARPRLAG